MSESDDEGHDEVERDRNDCMERGFWEEKQ